MKRASFFLILAILTLALIGCASNQSQAEQVIEGMVLDMAHAWEQGDSALLASILHEDAVFAYPGRRLNKTQTLEDLDYFAQHYTNTTVYIHSIIVQRNMLAVEWQFATTNIETGERQVVSDAIIAKVHDGKFISWKEYLDGRVKLLQASGELYLEEGEEPYPWPKKTPLYGTLPKALAK